MKHGITIGEWRKMPDSLPVADVRAPSEFTQGHIPGARNLPLFSNEERARVGTTYKQEGREAAVLLGFELTGQKWAGFIRQALDMAPQKRIVVHCWRGGMRSAAMAWALDLYGFEVYLLQGGYKSYRRWALSQLQRPYPFWVVGGMTGSGKTRLLHELNRLGEQVVDLEGLAGHRGSAYGSMNSPVQPTQEQFENELANRLSMMDADRKIWIEDESRNIGTCQLSKAIWDQIREGILLDLQVPLEERVNALLREYGSLDKEFLVTCTERICKRLGPEQAKRAILAIREGRMEEFIRLVLVYYDKAYLKGLQGRNIDKMLVVPATNTDPARTAEQVMTYDKTDAIFSRSGLRL
jgi:tRNA 2-selenouridine synthase